ncbi:MAG TPA: hypothetical protein VG826_32550 [Pirellulales bacterium]|nr:hypothetical protein [Pirellulales bacterium]
MRMLVTIPFVCLSTLAFTHSLQADENAPEKETREKRKETQEKDAPRREAADQKEEKAVAAVPPSAARLKSLMEQMEKLQRDLAETSQALAVGEMKEKQQKIMVEMAKAQEEMRRQMQQRGILSPAAGYGGPVDPSLQAVQQANMMLQSLESTAGAIPAGYVTGEHDPVEMGQKMVLAGLEVQVRALAAYINATDDKEAKDKLTKEFSGIVERVVEDRKKLRERTIQQLERRLAELKKNAEKDETAEQMTRRLLGGKQESADEVAAEKPEKPDTNSSK